MISYPRLVTHLKGRTTCPKCKKEFILDLPKDEKKHEVVCPKCKHKYFVVPKCDKKYYDEECSWEEHGEPRKTVLSSIKPKTNRPTIAAILLICVFSIGIATTVFSETFIETSLDVASGTGLTGTVEIYITNQSNYSLTDVVVTINNEVIEHKNEGYYYKEKVELGLQTIELRKEDYKTQKIEIFVTPFFNSVIKIEMEEGVGSVEDKEFDTIGCSIILAIFSAFALFAMLACIKRQHIDVALAGSFFSIFSFGFFLISSILSIIALIIIYKSRDEFRDGSKGKIF